MEYNLWKSVLLDWVNSTGFLVQNYENLNDPNIETFFEAFKQQIKSTHIKSPNVASFLKEFYKDFQLKTNDAKQVPVTEYVYIYSLFLHFACILHADYGVQQICNNMVWKNQQLIEKFLEYLLKINKNERSIVQSAIEEAESFGVALAQQSPINRNLQSLISNTSPQTPKSRMMNTWNLENRNLKAQLETERFERGYLEMQLSQSEKKLTKLDNDYKEVLTQNNSLKKQIQQLNEDDGSLQCSENDTTLKKLQREINEKENELLRLTVTYNEAKDDIDTLKEKLQFAESQIKSLNVKLLDSFNEIKSFQNQIDERDKMIIYVNNNSKELSELLKELQSNSKKQDLDSTASSEMLNSTTNDLNSSSFCMPEENLANAVVDIRLIDQQKQNVTLQNEIATTKAERDELNEKVNELSKTIDSLERQINIEKQQFELKLNEANDKTAIVEKEKETLQESLKKLQDEVEAYQKELETVVRERQDLQGKVVDLAETISEHEKQLTVYELKQTAQAAEIKTLNSELNKVNLQFSEISAAKENTDEQLKVINKELEDTLKLSGSHKNEISSLSLEKEALSKQIVELNQSVEKYKSQFERAQSKAEDTKRDYQSLKAQETELKQEIVHLNETIRNKEIQIEDTEDKARFHEYVLSDVCTKMDAECLKLKKAKQAVEVQLKLEQDQLDEKSKLAETLQNEISSLNLEKNGLNEKVLELNRSIEEKNHQIEKFEAEAEATRNVNEHLKQQEIETREKVISLTKTIGEKEKMLVDYKSKNATQEVKIEELNSELEKVSLQLSEMSTDKKAVEDQLSDARIALEESSKLAVALQNDVSILTQEKDAASKEIIELSQSIEQHKQQLEKYQDELQTNLKVYEESKQQQSELKENVLSLTNTISENEKMLVDYESKQSIQINEIQKLTSELENMKLQLSEMSAAKETVAEELGSTRTALVEASKSSETLQTEILTITRERDAFSNKILELSKSAEEQEQRFDKLQAESQTTENAYQESMQQQIELKEKVLNLSNQINENQKALADYELKLANMEVLTKEKEKIEKDMAAIVKQLRETSRALEATQNDLEKVNIEKSSLTDKVVELNRNIEEVTQQMLQDKEEFSKKETEFHEKLTLVENEKDVIKKSLEKLEIEIVNQSKEFEAMKEERETLGSKVKAYSEKIEELQTKLTEENKLLQEQISSLTSERDVSSKRIIELNQIAEERERQFEKVQTEIGEKDQLLADFKSKMAEMDLLVAEKSKLVEEMASTVKKLEETSKALEVAQADLATVNTEKNSLVSKIIQLNRNIDEVTHQMLQQKEEFGNKQTEFNEKLESLKENKEMIQNSFEKLQNETAEQRKEFEALKEEKETLLGQVKHFTNNIEELQKTVAVLKEENKTLAESSADKAQLVTINEQLVQSEKTHNEALNLWKKEKDELMKNMNILRAKLMKEREAAENKETEYKAMRNGFEEKLEKMKEKMKFLYKEEMAKVQEKHEKQLSEMGLENHRNLEKIAFLEERTKEFSSQIYALNEDKLLLLKEHEIMKSKLRTYEIGSTLNAGSSTSSASMYFSKVKGGTFRMEDEEGELFDNTYLDELKAGSNREHGRESLTLEEIQRRNSMVPPHLRSSYMPQFAEPKAQENAKPLDDSMFSNQSETKRGPAYKKPGPPTPSKHGGRFSLGGSDFARSEILREQNGERPSLGGVPKASKKSTPSRFSKIFSTTKLKGEEKENVLQSSSRNTLQNLQQLFFSTSTPRRRQPRRSSLPKFDTTPFGLANNSVSTIEFKRTTDVKRLSSLSRNLFAQTKKVSQKLLRSADKKSTNVDTPEYSKVHQDSTKLVSAKKSFIKKRASVLLLKKKMLRNKTQKDKRFDAYNLRRCLPKSEHAVDETYSIGSAKSNLTAATYTKSDGTFEFEFQEVNENYEDDEIYGDYEEEEEEYESEIQNFLSQVNENHGPIEIIVEHVDDEIDFEKLCNVKESECPFEDIAKDTNFLMPNITNRTRSMKSFKVCSSLSPQSINSQFSSNSGARTSSHCARMFWGQHKIPKITTYKAEKKSFETNSNSSSRSNNSAQPLITTFRSVHSNAVGGWQNLPTFVQYYLVSITVCFLAGLYIRFPA